MKWHGTLFTMGICSVLSMAPAAGMACEILEKQDVTINTKKGIEGKCSNGAGRITCLYDEDERSWTCDGPSGSAETAENGEITVGLIANVCGC